MPSINFSNPSDRLSAEVVTAELIITEKVEFSLEEHRQLIVRCRKDDLPVPSYDDFPKVVEKRKAVKVIDVSNGIINQNQRRGCPKLCILGEEVRSTW